MEDKEEVRFGAAIFLYLVSFYIAYSVRNDNALLMFITFTLLILGIVIGIFPKLSETIVWIINSIYDSITHLFKTKS